MFEFAANAATYTSLQGISHLNERKKETFMESYFAVLNGLYIIHSVDL